MKDSKRRIYITDVTLRDGHQSLLATRLRTEDMLPICPTIDKVDFWSVEAWGGATFDACIRYLKEDPWERLISLRKALPNKRLQMLLRGQNLLGYRHYADDVVRKFIEKAAKNGIDVFRIFDALNDVRNLQTSIETVIKTGKHAQGTLSYTVSPVHTTKFFVEMGLQLEDLGCHSIAIKDMAGLLTPSITHELVSQLKQRIDLPIFLHCHSTSGMSEMCHMKAVEAGCDHIDTAISSLAGGTSHPPTESMTVALESAGYATNLDLELLEKISIYFKDVRKKYHEFESDYSGVDVSVLRNQVPGGMMSNLSLQLKEQGALEKIADVFKEIPQVRKDLGYPPLVTPTSQIVGSQAVMNVLTKKRYHTITNEVKRYIQGGYGKPPSPIDHHLKVKALGQEPVTQCRPADLLDDEWLFLKKQVGDTARTEEDLLIYAMFPEIGERYLEERNNNNLQPEALSTLRTTTHSSLPTEFQISLHGETYNVALTGVGPITQSPRRVYLSVDGVLEEVFLETTGETENDSPSSRRSPLKEGDVSTTMPGNIIDILVAVGETIRAGDPLLVVEAMKMETEIKSDVSGTVQAVHVQKGDRVNPGESLVEIR